MEIPDADRTPIPHGASTAIFLAGWLSPQLAALALSAFRVPLWARFPQAGELLALHMMLAVQIGAAALMLPNFNRWENGLAAISAACPMALIASTLGAVPLRTAVVTEIHVDLWIVTCAALAHACRSRETIAVAWASAIAWSMGGGLLLYLRMEFSPDAPTFPQLLSGPIVIAINAVQTTELSAVCFPLIPTAISFVLLALSRALPRMASSRAV